MSFDQNKYINEYAKSNYDRIALQVPKGKKAEIKSVADRQNMSINEYVKTCIERCSGLDLSTGK